MEAENTEVHEPMAMAHSRKRQITTARPTIQPLPPFFGGATGVGAAAGAGAAPYGGTAPPP